MARRQILFTNQVSRIVLMEKAMVAAFGLNNKHSLRLPSNGAAASQCMLPIKHKPRKMVLGAWFHEVMYCIHVVELKIDKMGGTAGDMVSRIWKRRVDKQEWDKCTQDSHVKLLR